MGDRGRLTVQDLVYVVMSLGFLAALHPVLMDALESNTDTISTGPLMLMRLILPLAVLVLLWMIWRKATIGV